METLLSIWTLTKGAVSWIWTILTFIFAIPVIGFIAQLIFGLALLWLGYKIYQITPLSVRRFTRTHVAPKFWSTTRIVRWPIGLWLTRDYDHSGRMPKPEIIEKIVEVRVPMRRTLRQWLLSGIRWGLFWGVVAALAYNAQTIAPFLKL